MQSLFLEPTNYTPQVAFETSGNMYIRGRSLMLDAIHFYNPLIDWASRLNTPKVTLTIELDYLNTASSKKMHELLKILDVENQNIKEFLVYWAYEADDEDTLLEGQILEERLKKAVFVYQELAGV
ncbi:MAG: DUF1987 domain-containing protein [Bacteroidales bacterium]|nr:DUF1987 domain-containing protein [Bacteroidales bacterium]